MKLVWHFLNPIKWIKAKRFARKNAAFDKSTYDLELYLYSKILSNDMLHFGHFDDPNIAPDTISFRTLEDAQMRYAQNIVDQILDKENAVLDVGCGMGGLTKMIQDNGMQVECLTPNKNQIEHIRVKYNFDGVHHCKFEQFNSDKTFGTVVNSESLQYINLDNAFDKVNRLLLPDGRWIIVDYFRLDGSGINKSSHLLGDFQNKVKTNGWKVVFEQDISANILPTIAYANMFAERFLKPVKHFAYEKLRFKKPSIYYMTEGVRESIEAKITKEQASIDPTMFLNEKRYMFFVLERA
ncbi:MAG: SAM-dependent methyltransferase [Flavobacteriales bacterium]